MVWKGGQGHAHDAHGNNMNDKMQHEMTWDENALYDDDKKHNCNMVRRAWQRKE